MRTLVKDLKRVQNTLDDVTANQRSIVTHLHLQQQRQHQQQQEQQQATARAVHLKNVKVSINMSIPLGSDVALSTIVIGHRFSSV